MIWYHNSEKKIRKMREAIIIVGNQTLRLHGNILMSLTFHARCIVKRHNFPFSFLSIQNAPQVCSVVNLMGLYFLQNRIAEARPTFKALDSRLWMYIYGESQLGRCTVMLFSEGREWQGVSYFNIRSFLLLWVADIF